MWRIEVSEPGREPLPPVDLDGEELLIGSGEGCQLRLPAQAVRPRHLRLRVVCQAPLVVAWVAGHDLSIGAVARAAGASGEAAAPLLVELGGYRLTISEAPPGSRVTPPQRTESLARELVRNIMGGAAPRLVVEAGPELGSSRMLAPPESRLTIGRGDEADWVILDEDLSRVHAALVRTWDGVRVHDLGSKNGTRLEGALVAPGGVGKPLRDGARLALGGVRLRFVDDAERYLGDGEATPGSPTDGPAEEPTEEPAGAPIGSPADDPRPAARGASARHRPARGGAASTPLVVLGLAVALLALAAALYLLLGS